MQYFVIVFLVVKGLLIAAHATVYLSLPDSVIADEGDTVRIECVHTGRQSVVWIINGIQYSYVTIDYLTKHSVQGNTLTVTNIELSMNGSTYQCYVQSMFSNTRRLHVHPVIKPSSTKINAANYSRIISTSQISEHPLKESYATTTTMGSGLLAFMNKTVGPSQVLECLQQLQHGNTTDISGINKFKIALGVLVPSCFLLGCVFSGIILLSYNYTRYETKIRKKKNHCQPNITTLQNEAYEITSRFCKKSSKIPPPIYEHVN